MPLSTMPVMSWSQRCLRAVSSATLYAWAMVVGVAWVLSILRALQITWHWPADLPLNWPDLRMVMWQGARFDLKVSAAAAVLLWPVLIFSRQSLRGSLAAAVAWVFTLASLINLHYFGFYKTPIDPIVFGFFEDDTQAIVQTIWHDFPVITTLLIWAVASMLAVRWVQGINTGVSNWLNRQTSAVLRVNRAGWLTLLGVLIALFMLVLTTKGTLRAMALGRQNVSVTPTQFLNDMVPNGVMALKFAWDSRRESQNLSDPLLGLKRLGYSEPLQAARVLGLDAADEPALMRQLTGSREPVAAVNKPRNLMFFLMESWSAEPFRYHGPTFDVLGRLAPTLSQACHFKNFDSAQPGTHPSLEAILFSTPITPLTLGPPGKQPMPWVIPRVMKNAGYRTVFVTSARSGWRDLDRVLKVQGFDEVVDANTLKALYPEASLGIWGVWDSYVFDYLKTRLKSAQPDAQPLFVFVLTSTNHPPYDLPSDYQRLERDMRIFRGEVNADTVPNLHTYHYATDLLGDFVQHVQATPHARSTVLAATGDHNVRSFGLYATPERRYLAGQVPFVIWGADHCGEQQAQPASHRDMFPTLLPMLGISENYFNTGRNLLAKPAPQDPMRAAMSLSYTGTARDAQGVWNLGDPASHVCSPPGATACEFPSASDAQARARLGLLDWLVRVSLKPAQK